MREVECVPNSLYMDVHIPAAITAGLRQRGFDVLTCQDDGTTQLADEEILIRATSPGRVLFTQAEDFLEIVARWQVTKKPFFGASVGCWDWKDHH